MENVFCVKCCPNFLIMIFTAMISTPTLAFIFPEILRHCSNYMICCFFYFINFLLFFMFLWSWFYASFTDPGRIVDDLQKKGYLQRIQRGDIPYCLSRLKICPICQVPMPLNSRHCEECNACCLRHDHHCGMLGNCVGDKNTKAFILALFYSSLFCFYSIFVEIYYLFIYQNFSNANKSPIGFLIIMAGVYSFAIGVTMLIFSFHMTNSIFGELGKMKKKSVSIQKLLRLFGSNWWERITPVQKETTYFAWPDVSWSNEFEL